MYVLVLGLDVLGNPFGLIRGLSEGVEAFFYEPFQVSAYLLVWVCLLVCVCASAWMCVLAYMTACDYDVVLNVGIGSCTGARGICRRLCHWSPQSSGTHSG